MQSQEIRKRFLEFFEKRGHKVIPSASLVPENDSSVLFNTAGMQPLVPYLLGQKHPLGTRLVDIQKCVRTGDLEDIGDNRHFSFFEMMGNWSLGDYFKEEAIQWSYDFLINGDDQSDGDKGLGLKEDRLYITVFAGDQNAPKDTESFQMWRKQGIPERRIYFLPAEDNWWSPGDNGPCGPCSEMFYDVSGTVGDLSHEQFLQAVKNEDVIEIWNDVFMEYEKKDGKVIGKLKQKNVDTGAGLERITAVMQGKKTAYDTDLFEPIVAKIHSLTQSKDEKAKRIVADHIRTAVFMIADGVTPNNTGRGYVLRRLLRRAAWYGHKIGFDKVNSDGHASLMTLVKPTLSIYENVYSGFKDEKNYTKIKKEIYEEDSKFNHTLEKGLKEFEKKEWRGVPDEKTPNRGPFARHTAEVLPGEIAFNLFQTYGFPIELTEELAKGKGIIINRNDFDRRMRQHQDLSRTSSSGMFKGGLANHNNKTVKLHTVHHLLLSALQEVLGKEVKQRGSNITEERLRMDFVSQRKLTEEELRKVESIVNSRIKEDLTVTRREMPLIEAEALGAEMEFGAKYPEVVSVYFIEDKNGNVISKEFCGGPHVNHTGQLGHFKIQKEEASSAGVRRIKAILE